MNQTQLAVQYFSDQVSGLKSEIRKKSKKLKKKKVHELRVTLHRIRSLLELSSIKTQNLKKLDKALGKVRDLDVAIGNAKDYGIDSHELKIKRKQKSKAARRLLQDKKKKIIKDLKLIPHKFENKVNLKQTSANLKEAITQYDHQLKDEELHQVRISLKKVRYLLEAVGKPVDPLRKIQDQLGEVHDLQVLSEYFDNNPHLKNDKKIKSLTARKAVKSAFTLATQQLNQLH